MLDQYDGTAPLDETPGTDAAIRRNARAFATVFDGDHGAQVLDHLRRLFLDRRLGPTATDAELRHVEGQRAVVAYILALIERGRLTTLAPTR
jgi:hypothetical protein